MLEDRMQQSFLDDDGNIHYWPFETITAREVQLRALSKGFGKQGFAYFMRQRTGKTWTTYAEFVLLKEYGEVDWLFIVCPNSLKQQWSSAVEEVDMFTPICIYDSSTKGRANYFFKKNKKGGVVIINYESVKTFLNSDLIKYVYPNRSFIVFDESTKIKDPAATCTKACINFSTDFKYVRVLTGRPTANTNADIWSQLKIIRATERNFFQHKYMFCVMGGYMGRQVVKNINLDQLKKEIDPVSYIAEDKYIKGFEKVYEPLRRVNLVGRLKDTYEQMENELVVSINDDTNITAPLVITKYLRLQQIGSGIIGDNDGEQRNLIEPSQNPRIRAVKDILENEITNKVIIVCRFRLSVQNLYHELTKDGYNVGVIIGGMDNNKIEDVKRDFNEGDTDIIVAQLQVLSFGHTLCANDNKPCDSMIFYETDFSLINRAQCESRPEKMGRDKPISYYDFYASKMDKYIMENLLKKEEASLALMNYARANGMRPQGFVSDPDKLETTLEDEFQLDMD
jgi:hypothetical protein